jgi:hypothetical protein
MMSPRLLLLAFVAACGTSTSEPADGGSDASPVDATSDASATDGSASDAGTDAPSEASSAILWGAIEDGPDTYDFYYPDAGPWQNAPWGNTGNTMDKFDSNAGKKISVLGWGQPPPWDQTTVYGGTFDIVRNRGAYTMLTIDLGSATLADVASGKYDASITTWAGNVKSYGHPFFMRFAHEMNGNWYAWGQKPTDFVAAWKHFHDVVSNAGATNVTWVFNPNLDIGPYKIADYWPGDAYVDWMGLDGYNKGATSATFASLYGPSYAALQALSQKPIMICEIGSLEYGAGEKGAWIKDVLESELPSKFPQIRAFLWFNWRFYETDNNVTGYKPFPIESSQSSLSAFSAGVALPVYVAGGTFTLAAPLSKIAPP